MTYTVSVVVRGIISLDEDHLEQTQDRLEALGAVGPAIVFYPEDNELGIMFEIEEATLGRLLQPEGDRAVA